jgi:phage terminase small subunit
MAAQLTEKQKTFCDYLLTDPEQNQTKAYLHAYPKSSEKAAEVGGSKLVRNPKVAAYLAEARAKRSERTQIDADWLLKRLADEAEADLADLYFESGALKPVHMWPKVWRQGLVAGVKTRREKVYGGDDDEYADITEVKLADRNSIKKMIGDHIGVQAFKQRVDHGLQEDNPLAELLKQISGRTLGPK